MKWVPRPYMIDGVKWLVQHGGAALFFNPGLGKTAVTLAAFKILQREGMVNSMLVVAPLRPMVSVWPEEIKKWDDFNHMKVVILHGPKKHLALQEEADIYVINPEGLKWLAEQDWDWPEMLVVDESTKFKHSRTQRFKIMKKLLDKFRRRFILTGTPAPNGLLDLFGQVFLVDQGASLGMYITKFRKEYFYQTGYGGYTWIPKDDTDELIRAKISPFTLRYDDDELEGLPELIETDVIVPLPPKAMQIYTRLKREFVAELRAGTVTASNAGAKSTKLRQVASGMVYIDAEEDEDGIPIKGPRESAIIHDAKLDAVQDLIEEMSGQPVMVAYEFLHERDRLLDKLSSKDRPPIPYLGGGVSAKRGAEIVREWNAGELPILLVHAQSVAHGLNLQESGNTIVFFSLTWNLEYYDQLIRRLFRQGQKSKHVFVFRLLAAKTVDVTIAETLSDKDKTQQKLLKALKREAGVK